VDETAHCTVYVPGRIAPTEYVPFAAIGASAFSETSTPVIDTVGVLNHVPCTPPVARGEADGSSQCAGAGERQIRRHRRGRGVDDTGHDRRSRSGHTVDRLDGEGSDAERVGAVAAVGIRHHRDRLLEHRREASGDGDFRAAHTRHAVGAAHGAGKDRERGDRTRSIGGDREVHNRLSFLRCQSLDRFRRQHESFGR
jgi:hypothetical protein